jgi:F-type H+-transporting ATPase subunit b
MITRLLVLATESSSAGEGAFGLNLNLLETNTVNLVLLIGILVYFGRKTFTNLLSERRSKIAEEIQEAENRQHQAAAALAEQQEKLEQAQAEASRIRQSAEERAAKTKIEIEAQTERDIARLQETAAKNVSSEQERVVAELRRQIAEMAIGQAETQIKAQLDNTTQQQLIDRSIAQLGGRS